MKKIVLVALLFFFVFSSPGVPHLSLSDSIKEPLLSPLMPSVTKALLWDPQALGLYLQNQTQLDKACLDSKKWQTCIPSEVLEVRAKDQDKSRKSVQQFLREFSKWTTKKRKGHAAFLMTQEKCISSDRAYALALSLERDFPNSESQLWARELHTKAFECDDFILKEESKIRASLFYMVKGDCDKAIPILKQVSSQDINSRDRSLYLRKICRDPLVDKIDYLLSQRHVPMGMYGHLLSDKNFETKAMKASVEWRLQTQSQSPENSKLISIVGYYLQKENKDRLRWLSDNLDIRRIGRVEGASFQVTLALAFHKAGLDLPVFKSLHQVFANTPDKNTSELLPLMFPVRYWDTIQKKAGEDLDPILVKSLIRQESAFSTKALSPAKAMGLMQIIPSTARILGLKNRNKLYDPETNITVGTRYFRQLVQKFGSIELALAAYNAGPKRVEEWQKRYQTTDIELFVELIPFKETREYVRLIRRNESIYRTVFANHL